VKVFIFSNILSLTFQASVVFCTCSRCIKAGLKGEGEEQEGRKRQTYAVSYLLKKKTGVELPIRFVITLSHQIVV